MNFRQQPRSNKLESLPEDLRKIADQLIADKFPEDYMTFGIDIGYDLSSYTISRYFLGNWEVISNKPIISINTIA